MPSFDPVRIGLVGSGMIAGTHLAALQLCQHAQAVALADYGRDRGGRVPRGSALAAERGAGRYYSDYRPLLADPQVEVVLVALPNALHAEVTLAALEAGKHVIVEKPLCLSLEDADRIVALAGEKGLVAAYAEELCYVPKFTRAKGLVEQGAIGGLFLLKQREIHAGPYSDWFFDPHLGGGGALMDMGCHAIEYARWMFGKRPVTKVTAQLETFVHRHRRTPAGLVDDHCLLHLVFDGGGVAVLEAGWTLKGGMDSTAELQGTEGVLHLDLLKSTGLRLYSERGLSREDLAPGWSTPEHDALWQNGYPQELDDFALAVRNGGAPRETAADGRAVLEIIWAAYASAREGRTIELPYRPAAGRSNPVLAWAEGR